MIELNTILTEVEAVLNSHPLTYPYVDINDASPLTHHISYVDTVFRHYQTQELASKNHIQTTFQLTFQ